MALKIRLRQQGRANSASYRLVVTDCRNPRDGKYLEMLGWYNPYRAEAQDCEIYTERLLHWLGVGAQLSDRAKSLLKRKHPEVLANFLSEKLKRELAKKK